MKLIEKKSYTLTLRDGASLYVEERGEGDPVILIYGIACQMNHWGKQIRYLSQNFKVFSYDLRGHSKSTGGDPSYLTVDHLALDLLEMIDQLNLKNTHLVGHSFGVPVAISAASKNSLNFKSLSLLNGFINNPLSNFLGLNLPEMLLPHLKGLNKEDPLAFKKVWAKFIDTPLSAVIGGLTGGFNLKLIDLKDIEIYTRGVAQIDINTFLPLFDSLTQYKGHEQAAKITCPTLIIGGDQDDLTPLAFQQNIHQLIPKSELHIVPYGSHCCQLDFPEFVNLLLQNHFLTYSNKK